MKRILLIILPGLVTFVMLAAFSASGSGAAGPTEVTSALGRTHLGGQEVYVHVTVASLDGGDARGAAERALAARGAAPVQPAAFSTNGKWKVFGDRSATNDFVPQHYYAGSQPSASARAEFVAAQAMWNDVATSRFEFRDAGDTATCPSLVADCPGAQAYDGQFGAGWYDLGGVVDGSIVLGVTYFVLRGPAQEADMVLNSNGAISWVIDDPSTAADDPAPGWLTIDIRTVAAHEDGHFAGLGHSNDINALMYPSYQQSMWTLGDDDAAGISKLYPASDGDGEPGGGVPGYCKKHPERAGCP